MNVSWPYDWIVLVVVIAFVTLVLALESVRGRARGRVLRICSTMLVGLVLYGLINPPLLTKDGPRRPVLINLSNEEISDSLVNSETIIFDSFDAWLKEHQNYSANPLTIIGEGLSDWQLESIQEPFDLIPAELKEGLVGISTEQAFEDTPFRIRGDLFLQDSIQLSITGPDNSSVSIPLSTDQTSLDGQLTIPISGHHLINLLGIRSGDTIFSEVYPIYVQPKPEISVLVLSGFPTFELRFLTEWMTDLGYQLTLHQQTGEDLYVTRHLNQENQGKFRLGNDSFSKYQLVVMDQAYAAGLSHSQLDALLSAVRTGGAGLMLVGDISELNKKFPVSIEKQAEKTIDFQTDEGVISLDAISTAIAGEFIKLGNQNIARKLDYGIGAIIQPEIANSYVLKLQGLDDEYHQLWQQLLSESLARVLDQQKLEADPYARLGSRIKMNFEGNPYSEYHLGDQRISIRQSELFAERLKVEVWPEQQGWNVLAGQDTVGYVYVHPDSAWQTREAYLMQRATIHASIRSQALERKVNQISQPLSVWVWYGLLLCALAGLWVEHRMNA